MGLLVRLRIELADSPGSLARVAGIIASHGGNIAAVDVQHGSTSSAVDDVTVEFPGRADLAGLRRDLAEGGVARVLSHQTARPADPVVQVLKRLAHVLAVPSHDREEELRRGIAELCASPAVWVASADEAAVYEAGRLALELRGEATLTRASVVPAVLAETIGGDGWLLAVADLRRADGRRVVFVARPLTQDFTATEVSRIEALMALYGQLDGLWACG